MSARCSSRSSELLNVSRADIPYSRIRSITSSGSCTPKSCAAATPRCSRPGPHKWSRWRTSCKNILCDDRTAAETCGTAHKIQTAPADDNMPRRALRYSLFYRPSCVFVRSPSSVIFQLLYFSSFSAESKAGSKKGGQLFFVAARPNCNLLFCFVGTVSVIQLNFLFQHHAACHIANNVHAGSAHIA